MKMMQIIVIFFVIFFESLTCHAQESLLYEPTKVTLQGTLTVQNFAGPPNYDNIKKGDLPERAWILNLKNPVRVAESGDELSYTQENVREIQLVCDRECGNEFSLKQGDEVALIGTLFAAHTGHHHKGVLMNVLSKR